jgi:DNA replication and repair protein RecF
VRIWVTQVELANFRNYESFLLEPDERLTLLVGRNAAGKTNAVEAIELLTATTSFRRPAWEDVVREGADSARIALAAQGDDGRTVTITLSIEGGRRKYKVNGATKRTVAEVAGTVPAVVFTPEDLQMVKSSAERRRQAVDELGCQISQAYGVVRLEYERIVRQRNALLKEQLVSPSELEPWTIHLIQVGAHLAAHRMGLFKRMKAHIGGIYSSLSCGEDLSLEYLPSWGQGAPVGDTSGGDQPTARAEIESAIAGSVEARASEERARGRCLVGPHRDDIRFIAGGREARAFASQGQQRTIALAWKLAEIEVMEEITGVTPLLLLDDVMSELDEVRRRALTDFVGARAQTLITTTNLGYFTPEMIEAATVVSLS